MTQRLALNDLLTSVRGIGPSTFLKFQKKNVERVIDLLKIFPTRYEDFRTKVSAKAIRAGEKATLVGTVSDAIVLVTKRRGLTITKATLYDDSGSIDILWFNQPYIRNNLAEDVVYSVSGTCDFFSGKRVLKVSDYEENGSDLLHTGRIVPYYSESYGVTQKMIRNKIHTLLTELPGDLFTEYLPSQILKKEKLVSPLRFFRMIHEPSTNEEVIKARLRIAYEELLSAMLTQEKIRKTLHDLHAPAIKIDDFKKLLKEFTANLPFQLTPAQEKAALEITTDMGGTYPMNRLLLGDVGSGKTIVMAFAIFMTVKAGYRAIVLVPTETLANQHEQTLRKVLSQYKITVGLHTAKQKMSSFAAVDVIVSTHAVLYDQKGIDNVGIILIDEQHKFGVSQRNELIKRNSGPMSPHMLFVSATPIPRSLALTLFGSLEISYINEMPHDRKPVKTYVVPEHKRNNGYAWILKTLKANKSQMYVVCPLIQNSDNERMSEKKSVTEELEHLKKVFPSLSLAAIHSKEKNKEEVFALFKQGKIDILVSTTVIEVGIDVPNASIMLIEDADRFGLSQLHQLRGRVGRGTEQSFCLLFTSSTSETALQRLSALEKHHDGLALAEIDLRLRGSGNLFGLEQHGFSSFVEEFLFDVALLQRIKESAQELLAIDGNFNYNSLVRVQNTPNEKSDINLN
ncbi:MAG: ATP-dependent DNA helicase RecG [Patescibacteria group bacterium]|jgi:ATP-dependent DNA helicase RecG